VLRARADAAAVASALSILSGGAAERPRAHAAVTTDSAWKAACAARAEWEAKFAEMAAHHERHGRLLPKYDSTVWMRIQRETRATMPADRRQRLESLPFWKWTTEWEANLQSLVKYHEERGCMPPKGSAGRKWLKLQQNRVSRGTMSGEHKGMLLAVGGRVEAAIMSGSSAHALHRSCITRVKADVWEANLGYLVKYHEEHGCMPPKGSSGAKWLESQQVSPWERLDNPWERIERLRRLQRSGSVGGRVVAAELMAGWAGWAPWG
jgi:hypothetical protein